jgi:hypothetical protein
MNGYQIAIERQLPNVLSYLIQQRQIDQQAANNVFGAKDQWMSGLIQNMPRHEISEVDLQNLIANYVLQMIQNMNRPQSTFGMGMQQPQPMVASGWGQPQQNTNVFGHQANGGMGGGGGFNGFNQPMTAPTAPVSDAPIFGSSKPVTTPMSVPTETHENHVERVEQNIEPVVTPVREYNPTWDHDKENVIVETKEVDNLSITKFLFPSDEVEKTFNLLLIDYAHPVASKLALHDIVSLGTNNSRYIAKINYKRTIVEEVSTKEMTPIIKYLNELTEKENVSAVNKMKAVYKYLNTLPRGMFVIFEKILIERFNLCLKTKYLQVRENMNININITSLDSIIDFLPEKNCMDIEKIITVEGYANALEFALTYTLDVLKTIRMNASQEAIVEGLRISGDMNNIADIGKLLNNPTQEDIDTILETKAVMTFDAITFVTNMDLETSASMCDILNGKKYSIYNKCTSAIDKVLTKYATSPYPYQILDTNGRSIHFCFTADHTFVYSE